MDDNDAILSATRSVASLAPAVSGFDLLTTELEDIKRASARGYFTPDEDERVRARFAQYLSARAGLLQTIDELKPIALSSERVDESSQLRAFVIAYTATALLLRAARFIVEQFAPNKIVQRKLNEAEPSLGIPRKQYTMIYRSLTHPMNAWQIREATEFADKNRSSIELLDADPDFAVVLKYLRDAEESLRVRVRQYLKARLRYRWHSWRRRRASAVAKSSFSLFEVAGRVIADMRNPWHKHRVTPEVQNQLGQMLQPGDVIISRHDDAMSNLFLPGYWIHASLHIGSATDREKLGVQIDEDRVRRWSNPIRVLEARKDGVLFRELSDTLSVDCVVVSRPRLDQPDISNGLSRAVTHEGKLYDFELDFFRSDRLVCTEVVYRAYHGLGNLEFQLSRRAGRPTFAAEDIVKMAVEGRSFDPVAVFSPRGHRDELLIGPDARKALSEGG